MGGGRVDQASAAGILADHRKRIRALEATPSVAVTGLGYVLIEEIEVLVNGDTITFADIPQTFRHLVIEATLAGDSGFHAPRVSWPVAGGVTFFSEVTAVNLGAVTGSDDTGNADGVLLLGAGATFYLPDSEPRTAFTMKFPYYAGLTMPKLVLWQAGCDDTENHGDRYNVNGSGGAQFTSGGAGDAEVPITEILLDADDGGPAGFQTTSIASLYGIS